MRADEVSNADTLYIGGGTPTVLSLSLLEELVDLLGKRIALESLSEITVEANPGTLTLEKAVFLKEAGINRLSLGAQSFEDAELIFLGRSHNSRDIRNAIEIAREAGIDNLSLDLMFGLPGQDLAGWERTLHTALQYEPQHLSLYDLTPERGTLLMDALEAGEVKLQDDDCRADLYLLACDMLKAEGLERYEISNFAHCGYEGKHNINYWRSGEYLGIGVSACSRIGAQRWKNTDCREEYIESSLSLFTNPVHETEKLDRQTLMNEYIMLALRTTAGASAVEYQHLFGENLFDVYGEVCTALVKEGFLAMTAGGFKLIDKGFLLANRIIIRFMY